MPSPVLGVADVPRPCSGTSASQEFTDAFVPSTHDPRRLVARDHLGRPWLFPERYTGGKMEGAMPSGKMEGATDKGKMEGAMDKGKMGGAADKGKMGGAMDKGKME